MTPKPPPQEPPKIDRTYEVVVEDNAVVFRTKAQDLLERKFMPRGGISMVVFNNKLWVGQAFIRVTQYEDI